MEVGHGWTAVNARTAGAETRGWFLGPYVDYAPQLGAHGVQVKLGEHQPGDTRPCWAEVDETTTAMVVITGAMLMSFRDGAGGVERVIVRAEGHGDTADDDPCRNVVVWTRVAHTWEALDKCQTITVRWVDAPPDRADRDTPDAAALRS